MVEDELRERLPYRAPYNWPAILGFLATRSTPGVEHTDSEGYRRTIDIEGGRGTLAVRHDARRGCLELRVRHPAGPAALPPIAARVRRLFDLDANPTAIGAQLGRDPMLAEVWRAHPGIRTPGAWDPFELAVRAILGQQISVGAATTLAGRIAGTYGVPVEFDGTLSRVFPSADRLADAAVERLGVMPPRAEAIRQLAREVAAGRLSLDAELRGPDAVRALRQLPGIGPWTAGYIAMRAGGDTDALPTGDLVLRHATGAATAAALEALSHRWRPWRAYAVMLLWQRQAARRETAMPAGGTGRTPSRR